jgi:hypothetical protein
LLPLQSPRRNCALVSEPITPRDAKMHVNYPIIR